MTITRLPMWILRIRRSPSFVSFYRGRRVQQWRYHLPRLTLVSQRDLGSKFTRATNCLISDSSVAITLKLLRPRRVPIRSLCLVSSRENIQRPSCPFFVSALRSSRFAGILLSTFRTRRPSTFRLSPISARSGQFSRCRSH